MSVACSDVREVPNFSCVFFNCTARSLREKIRGDFAGTLRKRSSGSSRATFRRCGTTTGTSGMISANRPRSFFANAASTRRVAPLPARNGGRPVSISVKHACRALNQVTRWSRYRLWLVPGPCDSGVPAIMPLRVRLASSAARAMPKSVIFTRSCVPAAPIKIFAGLMSR